jgi:hypothetical protein
MSFGVQLGVLVVGLVGCQPSATKGAATPASASDAEPELREDTSRATAKLMGLWALMPAEPSSEKPSGWHRHAASGTCMPTGSQSWQLRHERVFGPDDEGVSLWNEKFKTLVSLFTYPAGGDVDSEMKLVEREMAGSCSEGPMLSTVSGERHFAGCVKRLAEDFLLVEQVMLIKREQWLYKVRITFPEPLLLQVYGPTMAFSAQAFATCAKD